MTVKNKRGRAEKAARDPGAKPGATGQRATAEIDVTLFNEIK